MKIKYHHIVRHKDVKQSKTTEKLLFRMSNLQTYYHLDFQKVDQSSRTKDQNLNVSVFAQSLETRC